VNGLVDQVVRPFYETLNKQIGEKTVEEGAPLRQRFTQHGLTLIAAPRFHATTQTSGHTKS
jgi:hypothetical protein